MELRQEIKELLREEIKDLKPYSINLKYSQEAILLHANENPFQPDIKINGEDVKVNRYPEIAPKSLRKQLAKLYGVTEDMLMITNGSDQAIALTQQVFCSPTKDSIIISSPTFVMYAFYAGVGVVKVIDIPLKSSEEYQLDVDRIIFEALENKVKLIFIPNPNAPIGNLMLRGDIIKIIEALKDTSIVVIDEAYIDFSSSKSFVEYIGKYDNLVVLRTLSKGFAMAGLRIGVVISQSSLIDYYKVVQPPYSYSTTSVYIAQELLKNHKQAILNSQKCILDEKSRVTNAVQSMSFVVKMFKSDTNYITVIVDNADKLCQYLADRQLYIKNLSYDIENCVRISIGSKLENNKLLELLNLYNT